MTAPASESRNDRRPFAGRSGAPEASGLSAARKSTWRFAVSTEFRAQYARTREDQG